MTKLEIIENKMYNKVVTLTTKSGDYLCGRLSGIINDENCLELTFRNGEVALIDIRDIKFIAPTLKQPAVVV